MDFNTQQLISAGIIGFDMIEGPYLRWYKQYQNADLGVDMNEFFMNLYLSFKSGNNGMMPRAILYNNFYIVAFPHGPELCCLFFRPDNFAMKLQNLQQIACNLIMESESESTEQVPETTTNSMEHDEIRRIMINLLRSSQMSTPELRNYFNLSNSEIWKLMTRMEEEGAIYRTVKIGRTQYWTANN